MNQDNISLQHGQQNYQTFNFEYNFNDSVYENDIYNCQFYDGNEINKKIIIFQQSNLVFSLNLEEIQTICNCSP